jgi:RND family efflux transporter MFP subunit
VAVTAVLVVAAAILGVWAFRFYEYSPWTRDGRISAYVVDSAPEIGGQVIEVAVQDNQFVHKGDLLYRIDPRDYEAAVRRTQAAVDSARARLALEQENLTRRLKLRAGDVSAEERQSYATNVQADQADLEAAQAALYKAQVDLERCQIRSTVNGWVTNLTVRTGNYANTGQRQMSVIDADSYWISGYFEETRLRNIGVGATARAALMGYPDAELSGHVESINRGIADTNTAPNPQGLPEVSPIFTWVRLAQRIPVRIHIDSVPDGVHLAIGETCTIYIDPPRR